MPTLMTISWPMISLRFRCRRRSLVRQSLYLLRLRQTAAKSRSPCVRRPLKIALFCLLFAAVVAVLAVLGVRYYTVPNGKEGEMLNPGGTALTVGETKSVPGRIQLLLFPYRSELPELRQLRLL